MCTIDATNFVFGASYYIGTAFLLINATLAKMKITQHSKIL